jgi:GntR family transcriptional repressor for pyruvate dehydrogenase complex
MPLVPVLNRSLADQVFDQIATEIVTGRYGPDDTLPPEKELAEVFGVNRQAVREALRRLSHAKLVQVTQGGRTRVLDFQEQAGLDLLSIMSERVREGAETTRFWVSLLELRAACAADVVRLCAERATEAIRSDLVAIADEMARMTNESTIFALDVRFWRRVNDGADNLAYRLTLNTMVRCSYALGEVGRRWSVYEARNSDFRRPIAAAIAARDTHTAEALTREVMREAVAGFQRHAERELAKAASRATPPSPGGRAATGT